MSFGVDDEVGDLRPVLRASPRTARPRPCVASNLGRQGLELLGLAAGGVGQPQGAGRQIAGDADERRRSSRSEAEPTPIGDVRRQVERVGVQAPSPGADRPAPCPSRSRSRPTTSRLRVMSTCSIAWLAVGRRIRVASGRVRVGLQGREVEVRPDRPASGPWARPVLFEGEHQLAADQALDGGLRRAGRSRTGRRRSAGRSRLSKKLSGRLDQHRLHHAVGVAQDDRLRPSTSSAAPREHLAWPRPAAGRASAS